MMGMKNIIANRYLYGKTSFILDLAEVVTISHDNNYKLYLRGFEVICITKEYAELVHNAHKKYIQSLIDNSPE